MYLRPLSTGNKVSLSHNCECLHCVPSLVEVEEEKELIPEAGELMRGGEGSSGGEKGGTRAQI